jgi:hypothetical protein
MVELTTQAFLVFLAFAAGFCIGCLYATKEF